jgi:hypothetical protein
MPWAFNPRLAGKEFFVDFSGEETDLASFLKMLIEKGIPVSEFRSCKRGLEDIFMKITSENGDKK